MRPNEVENGLRLSCVPYYCTIDRAAEQTQIPRWKIRHALDSGSLKSSGNGTIRRADLARWIAECHPATCRNMKKG